MATSREARRPCFQLRLDASRVASVQCSPGTCSASPSAKDRCGRPQPGQKEPWPGRVRWQRVQLRSIPTMSLASWPQSVAPLQWLCVPALPVDVAHAPIFKHIHKRALPAFTAAKWHLQQKKPWNVTPAKVGGPQVLKPAMSTKNRFGNDCDHYVLRPSADCAEELQPRGAGAQFPGLSVRPTRQSNSRITCVSFL